MFSCAPCDAFARARASALDCARWNAAAAHLDKVAHLHVCALLFCFGFFFFKRKYQLSNVTVLFILAVNSGLNECVAHLNGELFDLLEA